MLFRSSPKLWAIVDLPTRLAPSNNTAYLSEYFSFHSNNLLYTFLLKFIVFPFQNYTISLSLFFTVLKAPLISLYNTYYNVTFFNIIISYFDRFFKIIFTHFAHLFKVVLAYFVRFFKIIFAHYDRFFKTIFTYFVHFFKLLLYL